MQLVEWGRIEIQVEIQLYRLQQLIRLALNGVMLNAVFIGLTVITFHLLLITVFWKCRYITLNWRTGY